MKATNLPAEMAAGLPLGLPAEVTAGLPPILPAEVTAGLLAVMTAGMVAVMTVGMTIAGGAIALLKIYNSIFKGILIMILRNYN